MCLHDEASCSSSFSWHSSFQPRFRSGSVAGEAVAAEPQRGTFRTWMSGLYLREQRPVLPEVDLARAQLTETVQGATAGDAASPTPSSLDQDD